MYESLSVFKSGAGRVRRGPAGATLRALRLAARAAGIAAATVVACALLAVMLPGLAGYHNITITGGSMGSALPIGSVAVTRTIDFGDVHEGDVIVFKRPSASVPVVHRVVEIRDTDHGRVAITRGDANAQVDPEELALEGRGDRVSYYVPWVGYALVFVRSPGGIVTLTMLGVATWLLCGRKRSRRTETHAIPDIAA